MNASEWQAKLDAEFPDGANVTNSRPDEPLEDPDAYHHICARLKVVGMTDELPNVQLFALDSMMNPVFEFATWEDHSTPTLRDYLGTLVPVSFAPDRGVVSVRITDSITPASARDVQEYRLECASREELHWILEGPAA